MNKMTQKILHSNAGLEALILRIPTGLILAAHGSQKLFAWFGGYGLEGSAQWMDSIGLHPGLMMATLAGSAELFGGIALMLGILTRPAALASALTMLVALFWVHWANGFFLSSKGIEYALALLSATSALVLMGGGAYSLDRYLLEGPSLEINHERKDPTTR